MNTDFYKNASLALLFTSSLWFGSRSTLIFMNNQKRKNKQPKLLFCYGTLKRSFHWNHKYLWNAKYISEAEV